MHRFRFSSQRVYLLAFVVCPRPRVQVRLYSEERVYKSRGREIVKVAQGVYGPQEEAVYGIKRKVKKPSWSSRFS